MKKNVKKVALVVIILALIVFAAWRTELTVAAGEDLANATETNETINSVPTTAPATETLFDGTADKNDADNSTISANKGKRPSLSELYAEEDNLNEYVQETTSAEDLTAEELVEVIEELEELPIEDIGTLATMPAITVDQVVEAVDSINAERTAQAEADKAAGINNDTPDVGESNVETLEEIETPLAEVRENETTSVATTDNGVAIKVEETEHETTIATKTMVKVYGPAGYTAEYECGESVWSNIPLNGGYGQYTINVYQDVDGNGYKFVSQSREYKEAPVSHTYTVSTTTSTETKTEGTFVTPDFSRLEKEETPVATPEVEDEQVVVAETETETETEVATETVAVVEETPVEETEAPVETAEVEEPVVEDGMSFDDLLAGLGF